MNKGDEEGYSFFKRPVEADDKSEPTYEINFTDVGLALGVGRQLRRYAPSNHLEPPTRVFFWQQADRFEHAPEPPDEISSVWTAPQAEIVARTLELSEDPRVSALGQSITLQVQMDATFER